MVRPLKRICRFAWCIVKIQFSKPAFDFLVFFQSPHLGGGHTFLKMLCDFFQENNQKVHFVFERTDFTEKVNNWVEQKALSYSLIEPVEEVYNYDGQGTLVRLLFFYRFLISSESFVYSAVRFPAKKVIVNVGWPLSYFKAFFIPRRLFYFQHVLPRHDLDRGNLLFLKVFSIFRNINFVGVSNACAFLMVKNWKIAASKIRTIHHYNFPHPPPLYESNQFLPIKKGGCVRIITASRVEEGKNPELWLRVAKKITTTFPEVEFLWAGDGSFLEQMKNESVGYNTIHWVGQVDNVASVFGSGDIYFEPSKREAFGLSILEAMSYGLPVVTTKCGGPEEIVIHGETGFLAELENENQLYDFLQDLILNKSKRLSFAEKGTIICASVFSKASWSKKLSDFILTN